MAHILPTVTCGVASTPAPPSGAGVVPTGWSCPAAGTHTPRGYPRCHHCPEPPAFIAKGNDPGPIEIDGRP